MGWLLCSSLKLPFSFLWFWMISKFLPVQLIPPEWIFMVSSGLSLLLQRIKFPPRSRLAGPRYQSPVAKADFALPSWKRKHWSSVFPGRLGCRFALFSWAEKRGSHSSHRSFLCPALSISLILSFSDARTELGLCTHRSLPLSKGFSISFSMKKISAFICLCFSSMIYWCWVFFPYLAVLTIL